MDDGCLTIRTQQLSFSTNKRKPDTGVGVKHVDQRTIDSGQRHIVLRVNFRIECLYCSLSNDQQVLMATGSGKPFLGCGLWWHIEQ
jgi:hypothetical protein